MGDQNYICIHGHFYQPPRENPFTGQVPDQASAAPYPNWNERITAECYRANTTAPILGEDGDVVREINTYEWISFDFGPTLLGWLEANATDTYAAVIEADHRSQQRFGGHGSAMAQAYNHTILPLGNQRDKRTQVRWGIADFEHRFRRNPEGMWLPETAVDLETLEILADEGIAFTVLSPYQVSAVQGEDEVWEEVTGGQIDTRFPYRVDLGHDKSIAVFFYNGPLSQEIAFNGMLEDGRILAKRLVQGLGETDDRPLLSHVATDGETYGHHHRHGEMALAVAIEEIENDPDIALTNYGEHLSRHPATRRVQIIEDTSWSCAHGVDRWRADCGCSTGQHPGWNQNWRGPLRQALDWLRDTLIPEFEEKGGELLTDPWMARDAYIEVILGSDPEQFLDRRCRPGLSGEQRATALGLLEIQHRAMLMYTSCGWFFDDISGLESVLVLRHAGRVIDLTRSILGMDLEPELLSRLETAPSNLEDKTGRDVYLSKVVPFLAS